MNRVKVVGFVLAVGIALSAGPVVFPEEAKPFSIITDSIGMKLMLLPAGEFLMGGVGRGKGDDKPVHRVRITKPFRIGVYEVTQRQYESMGCLNMSTHIGPELPVQDVAWVRTQEFLRKLSEKEGVAYRLPTEAEWEYACRANTRGVYSSGELREHAWFKENSGRKPHVVGQKMPNAWGLHDMCGNVWEWCSDRYNKKYYEKSPADDPQGPSTWDTSHVSDRVLRGGCWYSYPSAATAYHRYRQFERNKAVKGGDIGFRVVREK